MKLPRVANVVDVEHDHGRLIEIGLTTVSLRERKILQTFSLPVKIDFELSDDIAQLTGWTTAKLRKQGFHLAEVNRRLDRYAVESRLIISDHSDEVAFIESALGRELSNHRLNVAILFDFLTGRGINVGLESMLDAFELTFDGAQHSAADDSRNIARLFLRLLPERCSTL